MYAWLHLGSTITARDSSLAIGGRDRSTVGDPAAAPLTWPTARCPLVWTASTTTSKRPAAKSGRRRPRERSGSSLAASVAAYEVDGDKLLLGEEARTALAQGDVYKALLLLEDRQAGLQVEAEVENTATAAAAATTPTTAPAAGEVAGNSSAATSAASSLSPQQRQQQLLDNGTDREANTDASSSPPTTPPLHGTSPQTDSPRVAHAKLIQILWRAGHEQEAMEIFDLARTRARDAAAAMALESTPPPSSAAGGESGQHGAATQEVVGREELGRRLQPPRKPGAGIPGLFLDLDPETCHGIMRRKLDDHDWQGVIETMRAATRVPPRREGWGAARDAIKAAAGGEGKGWAPTEETYACALEACARVSVLRLVLLM